MIVLRLVSGDPHSRPSFVSIPLNNLSMSAGLSGSSPPARSSLIECEHYISLSVRFFFRCQHLPIKSAYNQKEAGRVLDNCAGGKKISLLPDSSILFSPSQRHKAQNMVVLTLFGEGESIREGGEVSWALKHIQCRR